MSAFAAIDPYEFSREEYQARFKTLTEELRCPKCQNNNLADSNAPIAADMRREVHRMLEEGGSDQAIVDYMVDRYGDFVRYRPRQDASTALLWYGPVGLLVGGIVVILVVTRKRKATDVSSGVSSAALNQQRLKHLLDCDNRAG